jgi:hypothetical protein
LLTSKEKNKGFFLEPLIPLFCKEMQNLCKDYNNRLKNPEKQFDKGFWYAPDYYRSLKNTDQEKKLYRWITNKAFFHGHLSTEHFFHLKNPHNLTGKELYSFGIKKGIKPSEALESLEKELSFIDCGILACLGLYKALRIFLGEEAFNSRYKDSLALSGSFGNPLPEPLSSLLTYTPIKDAQEIKKGDICYFSNIKDYIIKHPVGESRGQYVVCCEENPHKYWGFGLSEEGSDEKILSLEFLDCYNREPLDEGYYPPSFWKTLYRNYLLQDEEKNRDLIASQKNRQLDLELFEKMPSALSLQGLPCKNKLALWVYRIT